MIHTKVVRNATTRVLLLEYELVCIVSIQYGYYYSRVAIMHTSSYSISNNIRARTMHMP